MGFDGYFGNERVVNLLRSVVVQRRLPQTLLFSGPSGVGKATIARFLAAAANCKQGITENPCKVCTNCRRMLEADLSSETIRALVTERIKMPIAKRQENPLVISTHPDLLIFPPDGPLQMITIEQARRLREYARFGPSEGRWRFFIVDNIDRASEEAANSLLKTLEEPAPAITVILTAENSYKLLPTIRSRAIPFHFGPLPLEEMERFFSTRSDIPSSEYKRLAGWAQGSPGRAVGLDIETYKNRRDMMLTLIGVSVRKNNFSDLLRVTESIVRRGSEPIEVLTDSLCGLFQDMVHCKLGRDDLINVDEVERISQLARRISFPWIEKAVAKIENIQRLERRNIQKQIALEALTVSLRLNTLGR